MDKYEKEAKQAREELNDCKDFKKNMSCWNCVDFFSCKIRKEYVAKTYKAMSKDSSGGFEF